MSGPQTWYVMALHGAIAMAVVIAATLLAYHGSIDGQTVSVVYGAALGLAGASASSIAALAQAVNGKSVVSHDDMAAREQTLRTAITTPAAGPPADSTTTTTVHTDTVPN